MQIALFINALLLSHTCPQGSRTYDAEINLDGPWSVDYMHDAITPMLHAHALLADALVCQLCVADRTGVVVSS